MATTHPSAAATTAASSPGPSSTPGPCGNRAVTAAISPNSPAAATVPAVGPELCATLRLPLLRVR